MKLTDGIALILLLTMPAFATGCATPASEVTRAETGPVAQLDQPPTTLAILPFENNAVTDSEKYEPLSKGLAAMLINDLNREGTSLKIIERTMIQSLLKEVALGQSGSVDQATAVRVGKMLGAQSIAFGSFVVLAQSARIDVRIIKVETSELIMAESVTGHIGHFMGLEQELAGKIAHSLRVALQPQAVAGKSDIAAALLFSRGLEALDNGNRAEAQRLFDQSIALDASYRQQVQGLKGLHE
jgi:TolB-like protein